MTLASFFFSASVLTSIAGMGGALHGQAVTPDAASAPQAPKQQVSPLKPAATQPTPPSAVKKTTKKPVSSAAKRRHRNKKAPTLNCGNSPVPPGFEPAASSAINTSAAPGSGVTTPQTTGTASSSSGCPPPKIVVRQ